MPGQRRSHPLRLRWVKVLVSSHFIYPLTAKVVGAPQMISQPVFLHFSMFSTALWDLPNTRPVHFLMLSSHLLLCPLVFVPLSLCLARWFWPDLMNGGHDHTTAVCVSLPRSGLRVVPLPAGSWPGLPRWWYGLCMRCVAFCGSTSFPWLVFFFGAVM